MKIVNQKILVAAFVTLLTIPVILKLTGFDVNVDENIEKKIFPHIEFPHFGRFIKQFDDYYKTNFGGRGLLVNFYNQFNLSILKTSPLPNSVVLGKSGWLFLGNSYSDVIYETIGLNKFDIHELDSILSVVKYRKAWLEKRNIKYYLAVAPNKHTVYSKYLPSRIKPKSNANKFSFLKSYLAENEFDLIDLKDYFPQYIDTIRLFYKTDSHWNDFGAFLAYKILLNKIKCDFPHVNILKLENFKIDTIISKQKDLSKMINLKVLEEEIILNPKFTINSFEIKNELEIPNNYSGKPNNYEKRFRGNGKLKALIFCDSFSNALIKYLQVSFKESVFVRSHDFDEELIEQENPDIVIHEIVERNIEILYTHQNLADK